MLQRSKHIIPAKAKKEPYYIVMQKDKNGTRNFYIKRYGLSIFPTYLSDDISETTESIWEAEMFCRKEDAIKLAKLCTFKCSCGCIHHVGKLIKVTRSDRKKDGVTYGYCDCRRPDYKKDYFETVWDVVEEKKEYSDNYCGVDGKKLEAMYEKNNPRPKMKQINNGVYVSK
jgi:hypothetical protein